MDKVGVAAARMTRGTRDSLMLAIGRGDTEAVSRMLDEGGVDPNDPIHKYDQHPPRNQKKKTKYNLLT